MLAAYKKQVTYYTGKSMRFRFGNQSCQKTNQYAKVPAAIQGKAFVLHVAVILGGASFLLSKGFLKTMEGSILVSKS